MPLRFAMGLTVTLSLVLLPAHGALGAAGKAGHAVIFPASGPVFGFSLKKSALNLEVEAYEDGNVVFTIADGRRINVYVTQGAVSEDGRITARFARFGRLAVEFRPLGKPKLEKPWPGCHGKPSVNQAGAFVGRIRFHGEHGFAEFDAGRARGQVVTTSRWNCGREEGSQGEPETEPSEEAVLTASTPNGRLSFYAAGHRRAELPGSVFFAAVSRRVGPVLETRDAIALARSPKAFEFDEALSSATVRPGWPFHGSAVFQRGAGGAGTWTGPLRVSFLGGDEALTGDRIEASLARPKRSGNFTAVFSRSTQIPRRIAQRLPPLP